MQDALQQQHKQQEDQLKQQLQEKQQQQQHQKHQVQRNDNIVYNYNPNIFSKNNRVNKNINSSYANVFKCDHYNNNLESVQPLSSPLSGGAACRIPESKAGNGTAIGHSPKFPNSMLFRRAPSNYLEQHNKIEALNPTSNLDMDFVLRRAMDNAAAFVLNPERAKYNDDNNTDFGSEGNDSGFASDDPSWNEHPIETSFANGPYSGDYKNLNSCNRRNRRMQNRKNKTPQPEQSVRDNNAFVRYIDDPSSVPNRDRYTGGRPDDPIYHADGAPIPPPPPHGPGSSMDLEGVHVDPTNLNHWIDSHTMVLKDKVPKAILHFLILPNRPKDKYMRMDDLIRRDGVEVVKQLVARAKILIARESKRYPFLKFNMGFHVAPTM
ncbi:hypothetical protein BGZ95_007012, partial [Linnemannia exigua]